MHPAEKEGKRERAGQAVSNTFDTSLFSIADATPPESKRTISVTWSAMKGTVMENGAAHSRMLADCKVLDFTQYLAGPTVTRLMAEMGVAVRERRT